MKYKDHSHHNYIPVEVVEFRESPVLLGVVVSLRFYKTKNLNLWQKFLWVFNVYRIKELYFWLPYKDVLDKNYKYSNIGPKSRTPYSKAWMEIKEDSQIYKDGVTEFLCNRISMKLKNVNVIPFSNNEIFLVTRKAVIKLLEESLRERNNSK